MRVNYYFAGGHHIFYRGHHFSLLHPELLRGLFLYWNFDQSWPGPLPPPSHCRRRWTSLFYFNKPIWEHVSFARLLCTFVCLWYFNISTMSAVIYDCAPAILDQTGLINVCQSDQIKRTPHHPSFILAQPARGQPDRQSAMEERDEWRLKMRFHSQLNVLLPNKFNELITCSDLLKLVQETLRINARSRFYSPNTRCPLISAPSAQLTHSTPLLWPPNSTTSLFGWWETPKEYLITRWCITASIPCEASGGGGGGGPARRVEESDETAPSLTNGPLLITLAVPRRRKGLSLKYRAQLSLEASSLHPW